MAGSKAKGVFDRLAGSARRLTLGLFVTSLVAVLVLRFVPPVASAFMIERYCKDLIVSRGQAAIEYDWADWEEISPQMALAAVAAEDQKFPKHWGFDFESIAAALEETDEKPWAFILKGYLKRILTVTEAGVVAATLGSLNVTLHRSPSIYFLLIPARITVDFFDLAFPVVAPVDVSLVF